MKRWLALILALLLVLPAAGCGMDMSGAYPEEPSLETVEPEGTPELLDRFQAPEPGQEEEPEGEPVQESETPPELPEEPSGLPEETPEPPEESEPAGEDELLPEHGSYTTKEDVALYIHQYGHLPDNFITKNEARELGWSGGSLEPYAPGMCIGGSRFGNYEGLLPEAEGRVYTECDIDTLGAESRGARRIVFSNDGLIYYTGNHYESFELLYGEE